MTFPDQATPMNPRPNSPLRVALLLDDLRVPRWVRRVVEDIQGSGIARVIVVVRNGGRPRGQGRVVRAWLDRRHLLYTAYTALDTRLLGRQPNAFERVDLSDLIGDTPEILVHPRRTQFSDYFPTSSLAEIERFAPDVALRFGFRILRGAALGIARHGVWSYHHDDNEVIRGGPPGFWEVMEDHPVSGSVLQVLSEELDAGQVLYRSHAPTHRRSVVRNKNHVYWKSSAFVLRRLRDLHEGGPEALARAAAAHARPHSAKRLYRKPTNREAAPLLARFALRSGLGWLADATTRRQWILAYALGEVAPSEQRGLHQLRPLLPPKDRFWADPFPVVHEGRRFVFFEDYAFATRRGAISVLEVDANGPVGLPRPALERPYHLSYPFVFRWRGELFMIPETAQNRTVELYRCESFPDRWTLEAVLLTGIRAVDATLHRAGEHWFMFVNIGTTEVTHCHDELWLFVAVSPLGPWRPHRMSPIVSDARRARPAGALFVSRGEVFRPAQDCSVRYGHGIAIQRILRLNELEFAEETVDRIEPDWSPGLLATHTYNRVEGLIVVDAMRRVPRFGLSLFDLSSVGRDGRL